MKRLMVALGSSTDRKTPRLRRRSVSLAKKPLDGIEPGRRGRFGHPWAGVRTDEGGRQVRVPARLHVRITPWCAVAGSLATAPRWTPNWTAHAHARAHKAREGFSHLFSLPFRSQIPLGRGSITGHAATGFFFALDREASEPPGEIALDRMVVRAVGELAAWLHLRFHLHT